MTSPLLGLCLLMPHTSFAATPQARTVLLERLWSEFTVAMTAQGPQAWFNVRSQEDVIDLTTLEVTSRDLAFGPTAVVAVDLGAGYDEPIGWAAADDTLGNYVTGEIFAEEVTSYLRSVAPDVDGDGRDDLLHDRELVLTSDDGFVVLPLPAPEREDKPFALPDVTGDGLGDLILVEHDVTPWPYYDIYGASTARLYPGTPTGYADEPLWQLDFLDGLWSVVAVQADDDPELELFGVVAGLNLFEWTPLNATGFRFDEVHTANPDAQWVTDLPGFGSMSPYGTGDVHAIGDLDHDGLDDVLVETVSNDPKQPSYQVLSGALDYDIEQPLVTFALEDRATVQRATVETADLNGDGELDLIAASWNGNVGHLHVWESPFLPQPGPTGDTGTLTTPSGATAPTADTGPPDLTTATTTPTPAPSEDPKACGCRSAPSGSGALLLTLLVPFARRRSRRPSCG